MSNHVLCMAQHSCLIIVIEEVEAFGTESRLESTTLWSLIQRMGIVHFKCLLV